VLSSEKSTNFLASPFSRGTLIGNSNADRFPSGSATAIGEDVALLPALVGFDEAAKADNKIGQKHPERKPR
jgi:hypothetical protein